MKKYPLSSKAAKAMIAAAIAFTPLAAGAAEAAEQSTTQVDKVKAFETYALAIARDANLQNNKAALALASIDWHTVLAPAFEATATREEKLAVVALMRLQTSLYSGTYQTGGIQDFITSYKGCSCKGGGLADTKYIEYIAQVEASLYNQKAQFITADNYTYAVFNSIINIVRGVDPNGVGQVAAKVLVINNTTMAGVVNGIDAHLQAQNVTHSELKAALVAAGLAWIKNYSPGTVITPDPDPLKPDPVKPDPVDPDPVKPDPVDPDPVKPDPVDPDPVKPEPVDPDPVKPDPVDPDPVKPDPDGSEVIKPGNPKEKVVVKLPPVTVNPGTGKQTVTIPVELGKQIKETVTKETPKVSLKIPKVETGKPVDLIIPAQVLLDIKNASPKASIVIESEGSKYVLPLGKFDLSKFTGTNGSLVITTKLLTKSDSDSLLVKMKAKKQPKGQTKASAVNPGGMEFVAPVTTVSVEVATNGKNQKIASFGEVYIEREFTVTGTNVDTNRATGAVISADGTIKALPTKFKTEDGQLIAVVKTLANSDDTYTVVESNVQFPDVKSGRAKDFIEALASKNIISGTTAGTYKPNNDVTRGQLAILLSRALGLPGAAYDNRFKDVKSTDWVNANGALMAAVNAGIITGRTDGTFGMDAKVTRAEAAAMIGRALEMDLLEFDTSKLPAKKLTEFTDAKQIGASTRAEVLKVYRAGIMNGTDKKEFKPNAFMKRDEMAIMLGQFLVKTNLMQELKK